MICEASAHPDPGAPPRGFGWFVDFRIYGPEQAAFNKTWKPGDLEPQA